jgi:hypothetical protein
MTPTHPSIKLELILRSDHAELLQGLDYWLQLGLISEAQIEQISSKLLSCPLPQTEVLESSADFLPVSNIPPIPKTANASWLTRFLTSFMAEIGVVWLLFLGVFMVVVSSGVLAASQWQNFSAVGQYGILWGYTLAFGIAGLVTGRRPALQLTGRMLRIATLLIIPVNFWMIDGFKLWGTGLGWIVGAIASLSLSLITIRFLNQSSRLTLLNQLALCGLHWGWGVPGWALMATYSATIGTAGLQIGGQQREDQQGFDLGKVAIAFSTLLVLGRALLSQQIPISDLGLAFGICGWLLIWVNRQQQRLLWNPVGICLLFLGWAVTVSSDHLWQALGVSILGLWLLGDRLRRLRREQDLVVLILAGLQTFALLRVIVPPNFRRGLIAWIATHAGLELGAWELTGLGFFAYVLILLGFSAYLRRQQQAKLAQLTNRCALGLGLLLVIPGSLNPLVRSLYLSLSTVTLISIVSWRSQSGRPLIYLTHITALLMLFSWIYWASPNLPIYAWSFILLGVAAIEWSFCEMGRNERWQESAQSMGACLIGINLLLLTNQIAEVIFYRHQGIGWQVPLICGLSILTIALRQYRQPTDLGLFGMAWATELLATSWAHWVGWEAWAIANIAFGLGTQLAEDFWLRRITPDHPMAKWMSLHVIPIIYATLGVFIAHYPFTSTTGLYTLATALTFIGVGRRQRAFESLIYMGIAGIAIAIYEGLYWVLPKSFLLGWSGAFSCSLAVLFYILPWSRWGWEPRPWRRAAIALPIVAVVCAGTDISIPTLFITASFYAWIARMSHRIRLSYLGVILANWAIFWVFEGRSLTDPLWYVSIISMSILYIVHVDPHLQSSTARNTRHLLRCLAVGLLGLTALYQSISWSEGLLVIVLGLGLIVAGLTLRVRAYLFIGTLIFLAQVLRQLWVFMDDYSMMLWGLGIALGLVLIWIAATFEARRSQAIALLQYWATELEQWE